MPSKKSWKDFAARATALLLALLPAVALAQALPGGAPPRDGKGYRDDRILLIPKPGHEGALANFHGVQRARIHRKFPQSGNAEVVQLPKGSDIRALIERYQKSGHVDVAEPDYLWQAASAPNDPSYANDALWHLNNVGQNFGTPDADIDAPEGWDILNSASNIIVAIVDTGVNYTHEDIAANMWINPGEIPGNGIDDDGNGVIDDVHGISALAGSPTSGTPLDDFGHGAHVAGILGAVGNNGIGVCGVAWRIRLMSCKFIDANGSGATSDLLECLEYARTNGARVINCSFVGPGPYSTTLSNAFWTVRNAGIVVVTAAGNSGLNNDETPYYPASFKMDNLVAVAATTRNDDLWSASHYGATTVHLGAPGVDILSTWLGAHDVYYNNSGTSMAAPVVSGVAALLRAKYPNDTAQKIVARLLLATDPLPGLAGKCVTGGRVNLRKALDATTLPIYSIQPAVYDWVQTNGMTFVPLTADGLSSARPLPFTFRFFANSYTQLYIAANGLLGFANAGLGIALNQDIPGGSTPNAAIYPYWDDLNPTAGGSVWFGTHGQAPNRSVVVSWVGVPHNITSPPPLTPLTFQVILHESGPIAFQYEEVENGRSNLTQGRTATIGLEDAAGLFGSKYSFNGTSALVTNHQAILFLPSHGTHPSPTLAAASFTASGPFPLQILAEPARNCVLQASTNLINWSSIWSNTVPASGRLIFTDAVGPETPRRFYRALLP